jgi:hypothetical protein
MSATIVNFDPLVALHSAFEWSEPHDEIDKLIAACGRSARYGHARSSPLLDRLRAAAARRRAAAIN